MERKVTRRRLLVAGGAALFAGCGGQTPTDSNRFVTQETPAGVATTAQSDSSTPTATRTEAPETETPEGGPSDGTETPAEQETQTATPSATEALGMAEQSLRDAIGAYTGNGGLSITNTTAATALDADAVSAAVDDARAAIDTAESRGDVEAARVRDLRGFAAYVERLVSAQQAVNGVYDEAKRAADLLQDEETGDANGPISFLDSTAERERSTVETFDSRTDTEMLDAVAIVRPAQHREKVTQFEGELDGVAALKDPLSEFRSGIDEFVEGLDEYIYGRYRNAGKLFYRANRRFRVTTNGFEVESAAGGAESLAGTLRRASSALKAASSTLVDSSQAGYGNEEGERTRKRDNAADRLDRNPWVSEMPTVAEFVRRVEMAGQTPTPDDDGGAGVL